MTCRVALLYQKPVQIKPVYCGKCGAMNLEAFFSSQTLGLYLCPICAQSMIASGVAKELGSEGRQEKPLPHRASLALISDMLKKIFLTSKKTKEEEGNLVQSPIALHIKDDSMHDEHVTVFQQRVLTKFDYHRHSYGPSCPGRFDVPMEGGIEHIW